MEKNRPRTVERFPYGFASLVLLFASFASLRVLAAKGLEIDLNRIWELGLRWGLVGDLAFALLPIGVAILVLSFSRRLGVIAFFAASVGIWVSTAANAIYFRFFKSQLELWMIAQNRGSVWSIRKSAAGFLSNWWIVASLVCLICAFLLFRKFVRTSPVSVGSGRRVFAYRFGAGVALLMLTLLVRQSPTWAGLPPVQNTVISDTIIYRWVRELREGGLTAFYHRGFDVLEPKDASHAIRAFSKSDGDDLSEQALTLAVDQAGLGTRFKPDSDEVKRLREELGLPSGKPLNVVILFLESARAFEFLHENYGEQVFPNLRKVISEHGVLFKEAYSSALVTVSGQFSSLCSMLPRQDGPPVYFSQPFLKIKCLSSLFAENGYDQYWMNPYRKSYGGKYLFESNQGMSHFLDEMQFHSHSEEDQVDATEWGIGDKAFYKQAYEKLENLHKEGRPFFAHVLGTGTHNPWVRPRTGVSLSPEFLNGLQESPEYAGYVESLNLLDQALGEFFSRFFASPMAEDTVVLVLSDHGQSILPTYPQLTELQQRLLTPRIIFSLVTKNMKKPAVVEHPVNQLDAAPLLATVAGLEGEVSWVGRNPLPSIGTPWVAKLGGRLSYRTKTRLCSELLSEPKMKCWRVPSGVDALLEAQLELVSPNTTQSAEMLRVVHANESLIETDSVIQTR